MNQKKIGEFIATLRKEQNMTQEELASLLYINRESVSKWERGVNIPDPDRLLKLSKIFNVSINEILNGEKITPENKEEIERVPLRILEYKDKKIMHLKILILFIIVISIGAYLMKSYYSHVSVYEVGYDKKYSIKGIVVNTFNKDYLYLGNINNPEDVEKIEIYSNDNLIFKSNEEDNKDNISVKIINTNIDESNIVIKVYDENSSYDEFVLDNRLVTDNRYIFRMILESFNKNENKEDNKDDEYTDVINYNARTINNDINDNEFIEIKIENANAVIKYYEKDNSIEIIDDDYCIYSLDSQSFLLGNCDSKKGLIDKAIKELNK